MPDLTPRIRARLAAWICFFCEKPSTGSGACTNCNI